MEGEEKKPNPALEEFQQKMRDQERELSALANGIVSLVQSLTEKIKHLEARLAEKGTLPDEETSAEARDINRIVDHLLASTPEAE